MKLIKLIKNPYQTINDYRNIISCEESELRRLYHSAFPKDEQFPFYYLKKKAKHSNADFFGIYDDVVFVGLVYNIYYKDMIYIFYFAIDDGLRGQGYGSRTLAMIKKHAKGKRVLLNIEHVDKKYDNYEERITRKGFYEKNGFKDCNILTSEKGIELDLLSYGGQINKYEYSQLLKRYFGSMLFNLFLEIK